MIKMLKKSWKQVIAVMLTVVFLGSPGIIGFAAAATANASGSVSKIKVVPEITGNNAKSYKETVMKLATTQGISNKYQLDTNKINVRDFDAALSDGIVVAYIPIIDNTGRNYSFYAAYFNKKDNNLAGTMAIVFNKVGNLYEGTFIKDSKEVLNVTMKEDGTITEGWKINPDGSKTSLTTLKVTPQYSGFWDCFNQCLSSHGAAGWAIALIASVCAIACKDRPNPPGCVACAIAEVAGLAGIATGCGGWCAIYA